MQTRRSCGILYNMDEYTGASRMEREKAMSEGAYELLALAARYWFVLLIALIVARGWHACVTDNRRGKLLRGKNGDASCVGELLVIRDEDHGRLEGKRFPVPAEGMLGRRRADQVPRSRPKAPVAQVFGRLSDRPRAGQGRLFRPAHTGRPLHTLRWGQPGDWPADDDARALRRAGNRRARGAAVPASACAQTARPQG